ncbi:MAG TPA: LysR substrate-binding domain-containing protein [Steroidobacteraceae bacterium]
MNSLSDVTMFIRVAESSSFVNASESLEVSPSATSKAVKRLEARLGARLLNRSTRSVSLTDLGTEYFERCRAALSQLEQAESDVVGARGAAMGLLRIEVPVTVGRNVLVPSLPGFMDRHPRIRVHVTLSDNATDLVQAGFDAAIRIGDLPDSSLIARRVGRLVAITCASPDFIAHNGLPLTPRDIRPEQCIALSQAWNGQTRSWVLRKDGIEHVVTPSGRLTFSDVESAVSAAIGGAGFVRALRVGLEAPLASGKLQAVLEDWNEGASWPVYVVYPSHKQPTAKVQALIDFASTLFGLHE